MTVDDFPHASRVATLPLRVAADAEQARAASPSRGASSKYSTVRWGAQLIDKLPSLRPGGRKKSANRTPGKGLRRQESVVEDEIKLSTLNRKSIVGDRRSTVVGGSPFVPPAPGTSLPAEPGSGHIFRAEPSDGALRWCDICGEPIYSLLYHAVRCENCGYLCHEACRPGVGLDCPYPRKEATTPEDDTPPHTLKPDSQPPQGDVPVTAKASPDKHVQRWARRLHRSNTMYSPSESRGHPGSSSDQQNSNVSSSFSASTLPPKLSRKDVEKRVIAYSQEKAESDFKMVSSTGDKGASDEEAAVFEGYLHVTLCLHRPISVANEVALDLSLGSINKNMSFERCKSEKRTTFYLPYGSVMAVRCRSSDKTLSVISALLSKFAAADDCRKYALFDDHVRDDIVNRRRINELENPLYLALLWGPNCTHNLVLEENETSEIQWECFTTQELHNFLEILSVEQSQQEEQIREKYDREKALLEEKISYFTQLLVNTNGVLDTPADRFVTAENSPVHQSEA